MDLNISLFGEKKGVFGWVEILEQEKLPFRYIGKNQEKFSPVNILTGFEITSETIGEFIGNKKIFVLEPPFVVKGNKSGEIPKISIRQRKNLLLISRNISSLLLDNKNNRTRILNILKKIILKAFKVANLPYVHIWYYPTPCRTIFLFRQDVDYVDKVGMKNLIRVTSKFNIRGTYFVNISGEEEFDEQIGHLKMSKPTTPIRKEVLFECIGQDNEMANHGYWHMVFDDFQNNFHNIKKCSVDLYKLFCINAKGFASPGAEWNINLAKAIDKNELLYSCNGLNDGGFPYHPYLNNGRAKVLEVPFYFLCDASLEHIDSREAQMVLEGYYLSLIKKNTNESEPIAIIGHPHLIGGIAMKFYLPIFQKINDLLIPNLKIEEFVYWWSRREKAKLSCRIVNNKLIIKCNCPGILFEVIYNRQSTILQTGEANKIAFPLR